MRECGLGINSAKVISQIVAGNYFSHLDLGKNNLGNDGVEALCRGLKNNWSLIYLDIGSNDLTFEGAQNLFRSLLRHSTISSISIANHDRLHRNRIGPKACPQLRDLLINNKIISMLNIADNGIGNDGMKTLEPALSPQLSLVYLNLSNNDLNDDAPINSLNKLLYKNPTLLELDLSKNKIGDAGIHALKQSF